MRKYFHEFKNVVISISTINLYVYLNHEDLEFVTVLKEHAPQAKTSASGVTTQLNINHIVVFNRFLSIRAPWSIGIRAHTSSGARSPHLHLTFPKEQIGRKAS